MNEPIHKIAAEEVKPSLVSPIAAAIASALVPGLGQMLARSARKGITLLASIATIVGLLFWRFKLTAPRDTGWVNIIQKSFHLDKLLLLITILVGILYLWTILDAYLTAKRPERNPIGVMFFLLVVFFAMGWQVAQIGLVKLATDIGDAGPNMAKIMWPWERALEYPEEWTVVSFPILVPCDEDLPETPEYVAGLPFISSDPVCGESSLPGLTAEQSTPGTTLALTGEGFEPGVEIEIWWRDPMKNEFRAREAGDYVRVVPDDEGGFVLDQVIPYRLLAPSAGADEGSLVWHVQARQLASVGKPTIGSDFKLVVEKIIETIFIGMMATFFGIMFALPVSFFAARNLMSASPVTLGVYYAVRAVLNLIRSIEPLIWAIIAVTVVGLGPYAGTLALMVHSVAALGKLYSESIESIDTGPIEAIQATGANWVQTVMFGVVPQIIPPFVSFTIYRWDINIRMSTIIGFVGGGGIGFLLQQFIRLLDYRGAGMAVWFIAITVAILDYISAEIRVRFV